MKKNLLGISVVAMLVLLAGGCKSGSSMSSPIQRLGNAPPDELSTTPLVVDGAMQLRDWSRSTALYANGDTIAGPTGFWYEPRWGQSEWLYAIEETPLFVAQTIMLPVTLTLQPPWSEARYTGVTIDPTYTAMPVLPPPMMMTEAPADAPMEQ